MIDRERAALDYERYRRAIAGHSLPVALVDLDALEKNLEHLCAPVRAAGKTLRIASKSVRCLELLRHVLRRGAPTVRGVMAFSCAEARWLASEGITDLLVAYPTARLEDARLVAEANAAGAHVSLAVDDPEHLRVASAAATEVGVRIPVIIDVDASYRPAGLAHVGVRRSPLHGAKAVGELCERIASLPGLGFGGLLAYEAHIAGVPDDSPLAPVTAAAMRAMKRLARAPVAALRAAITAELGRRGVTIPLFNGGGTGSVLWSALDPSLTEVAAGSGLLDSHLFDRYRGLPLAPAAYFALQVTRRPAPGYVTCQGGGFVASGASGPDRLPVPALPAGLRLTTLEGAGEVQTPVLLPRGVSLSLGEPVFFRHAKAGELAEHFTKYLLVRGDRVESEAPTYRGSGKCFA